MIAKAAKLLRILRAGDWRAALRRHRVAAGVEHAVVLRQLDSCRAVVDIGANRGQFALAVRHVFPDARIVAFEPLPGPAARKLARRQSRCGAWRMCSGRMRLPRPLC